MTIKVQTLDPQNLWIHEDTGTYLFCQLRHYPSHVCPDCDAHPPAGLHSPFVTITREDAAHVIFEIYEGLTRIEHDMRRSGDQYWTWRGTEMLTPNGRSWSVDTPKRPRWWRARGPVRSRQL